MFTSQNFLVNFCSLVFTNIIYIIYPLVSDVSRCIECEYHLGLAAVRVPTQKSQWTDISMY